MIDTNEIALVKTFPLVFFREVTVSQFVREFVGMNNNPELAETHGFSLWQVPLNGRPKRPVAHCYIVIANRIRYRAAIVDFEPGGRRHFGDGRSMHGNCWMILSDPVVRAPRHIPFRGFQGIRYTPILF